MDKSLVPPAELDYGIRVGDFAKVGTEFAAFCHNLGGLRPDGSVLDVGCGFGPLGAALTESLTSAGRYEAFDVVPVGVEWGRSRITSRYPNFRFTWVDAYNETYHRAGRLDPRNLRFPYDDASFDLVHLRSVFTHMLPEEVDNYLGEIVRVMRPAGRCLISYFLLNEESLRLMVGERSRVNFLHDHGTYRRNREPPKGNSTASDEQFVLGLYRKHGLRLLGPIHYGIWCGREKGLTSQDVLVASKGGADGI